MSERRLVKVACTVPNGLTIHLPGISHDDGTGHPIASMGQEITLAGPASRTLGVNALTSSESVFTEVDEEAMKAWMERNALNPAVTSGAVYIIGPVEKPEEVAPVDSAEASSEVGSQQVEAGAAGGSDNSGAGGDGKTDGNGEGSGESTETETKPKNFDADHAEEIGGYPKDTVLASIVLPSVDWVNTVDGNKTDPDSAEAEGWVEREITDNSGDNQQAE